MMPPKWSVVGMSYWEATLAQSQQTLFRFELSAGCRIPRFPTRKPGNWEIWASLPTMAWTQVGSRKIMDGWIAGPKVIQYKLIRFAKLFSIVFEDKHRIAIELMRWPTVSGNSTAMSPAKVKRGQLPASKLPSKQCKMFNRFLSNVSWQRKHTRKPHRAPHPQSWPFRASATAMWMKFILFLKNKRCGYALQASQLQTCTSLKLKWRLTRQRKMKDLIRLCVLPKNISE